MICQITPGVRRHTFRQLIRQSRFTQVWLMFCILSSLLSALACRQSPQPTTPLSLAPARPIIGEIGGAAIVVISLTVPARHFFRVAIEQHGIDLNVTLQVPGAEAIEIENANGSMGREQIFGVTSQAGDCQIEISTENKQAPIGRYVVTLLELAPAEETDDPRVLAQTIYAGAKERRKTDQHQEAIAGYEKALKLWQSVGERDEEAQTLSELGYVHSLKNEYPQARIFYERAVQVAHDCGNRAKEALASYGLGVVLEEQFEKTAAQGKYEQAAQISRAIGDLVIAASALNNLGALHRSVGEYQAAIDSFLQAQALWQALGDRAQEGNTTSNLGSAYRAVGDKRNAIQYQEMAFEYARQAGDPIAQAQALNGCGMAFLLLGDATELDKAISKFEQARQLLENSKDLRLKAATLGNLGMAYDAKAAVLDNLGKAQDEKGEREHARLLREQARLLLDEASRIRPEADVRGRANTLTKLGLVYLALKQYENAQHQIETALPLAQLAGDHYQEATTQAALARLFAARGEFEQALRHIEQTLEIVQGLRVRLTNPDLRASFYAAQRHFYELRTDLLMQLHRRQPQVGYDRQALLNVDAWRACALMETLRDANVEIRKEVGPVLLEQKAKLQSQLNGLNEKRAKLFSSSANQGEEQRNRKAEELRNEEIALKRKFDQLEQRLRQRSPRYAELFDPQPPNLAAIQRELAANDALLLEYHLGEQNSYLWVIAPDSVESFVLGTREEIEREVKCFSESLYADKAYGEKGGGRVDCEWRGESKRLSQKLLAPVAAWLGKKRLMIVADSEFQRLPFAALPLPDALETPDSSSSVSYRPLILEHEILFLPSATMLGTVHQNDRKRILDLGKVLVVADPIYQLSDPRVRESVRQLLAASAKKAVQTESQGKKLDRVPFTGKQADSIRALLSNEHQRRIMVGSDADLSAVLKEELSLFRHLIFALHGEFDHARPVVSGLYLSKYNQDGQEQKDFLLSLAKIYDLDLRAEGVILSACDTGRGSNLGGAGMQSVARGFISAGTNQVVAPLFKVTDGETEALLDDFYRELLGEKKPPPAAALRIAQKKYFESHPKEPLGNWAGFVAIGKPGR